MHDGPLIFAGCAVKKLKANPARTTGTTVLENAPLPEATEQEGDLRFCDLWKNWNDSDHSMPVVNTYVKSQ